MDKLQAMRLVNGDGSVRVGLVCCFFLVGFDAHADSVVLVES